MLVGHDDDRTGACYAKSTKARARALIAVSVFFRDSDRRNAELSEEDTADVLQKQSNVLVSPAKRFKPY